MSETPIFTDGKHIYVIATFYVEEKVGHQVEVYCSDTWKCIQSVRLILESDQNANISSDASAKIVEETEKVKFNLTRNNIIRCNCTTNRKVMTLSREGLMYFFDLETGKRFSETINVSTYNGEYNNLTNTFQSYN